jgi:AcrR family transcriptional regulator
LIDADQIVAVDGRSSSRRGPETREAIHGAAIDLFARLGYHATSMRALAAAAQVQPAAIYHWYPNKEAILVRLQDDFMEQLTGRVIDGIGRQERPALKLAAAVREHVVFHGLHTSEAFVTDSEIRALGDAPRQALIDKRDAYQELFNGMIRDGIADGSLHASDVHVATYAILLQCTGVALWFDPAGPLGLEEVAELHVELVLSSLQASAELVAEAIAGDSRRPEAVR